MCPKNKKFIPKDDIIKYQEKRNTMNKKLDKNLEEIIKISVTLYKLYKELARETEEERKETLQNINLVKSYENRLYNNWDWKKENKNTLLNRFNYLLAHKNMKEEEKNLLSIRFESNIWELLFRNPFLSISPYIEEYNWENSMAILMQANRDIGITLLYYLNKEIEKAPNKTTRKELTTYYYRTIFTQKSLEPYEKHPPTAIETSGRKRCIVLGQDKENTRNIYQSAILETVKKALQQTINYTDEELKKHPKSIAEQKFYLNTMKAALSITTPKENQDFSIKMDPQIEILSSKSYHDILSAIEEIKEQKNLQKIKSSPKKS